MPTDHACQAAAELAARGVAPARAVLVPAHRFAPPRQDVGGPSVEPVDTSTGAAALLTFLDGLRADLGGAMVDWYSALIVRFPQTLGAPAAAGAVGLPPARLPNGWQSLADLQGSAQDVLTALAGRSRGGRGGSAELSWRLALLEDVFAGALRRMGVPDGTSVDCAAELAGAAGSLFGLDRSTSRSAAAQYV